MTPREKFQALLKKLFQFDNAELDFGIYRIMNHKRAVIERFIETDLIKGLDEELKRGAHAGEVELARQLAEATAKIRENFGDDALDVEGKTPYLLCCSVIAFLGGLGGLAVQK